VYRAGGPIDFVYFPRSGLLSAMVVMEGGGSAEAAGIGREGMVGLSAGFGGATSPEAVLVQIAPCECHKVRADVFAAEEAAGGAVRQVVNAHLRGVLTVSARQAACNCLHSVEERCARWL
jgi:hypothetical protein